MASNWAFIPPDVLVFIFKLLNDEDLYHSACTCTSWNNVSKTPCLWRKRTFVFRGYCRSYSDRINNITGCIRSVGTHIRELTLSCPTPNLLTANNVTKCVRTLFKELLDLQLQQGRLPLQSFVLKDLVFEEFWSDFRASKRQLILSLTTFLSSHLKLRSIDLSNAYITSPFAFRVMEALTRNKSAKNLERVYLENFFSSNVSQLRRFRSVRALFSSFSRLKRLSINECYISDNTLITLCSRLENTLQQIDFHVYCSSDQTCITHIGWKEALQKCPALKVTMNFNFWSSDIADRLLSELPLAELNIRGFLCGNCRASYSSSINRLLSHLSEKFPATLRVMSLLLSFGYIPYSPSLRKDDLLSFWANCPKLQTAHLSKDIVSRLDGSRHRGARLPFDTKSTLRLDDRRRIKVRPAIDPWRMDHFCFYLTNPRC